MKPSIALDLHRAAIRAAVLRRRAVNPRVFGSALRGEDREHSDLHLLADAPPSIMDTLERKSSASSGAAPKSNI